MIRGITLSVIIAFLAFLLRGLIPNLGSVAIAIILGLVMGNVITYFKLLNFEKFDKGFHFVEKYLLPISIALMGISISFADIFMMGIIGSSLIAISLVLPIILSLFLFRFFGISKKSALLIGVGNAVCGTTAIVASASVISPTEDETGLSISAINVCGILGFLLIPIICLFLNLSNIDSGMFIGSSLQSIGHVFAAGFAISSDAGEIALIIKMSRVLCLGLVVTILGLLRHVLFKPTSLLNAPIKGAHQHGFKRIFTYVPFFILAFLSLACINSFWHVPPSIKSAFSIASHALMLIGISGVGLKIQLSSVIKEGPKTLFFAIFIWCIQVAALLGTIWLI